MHVGESELIKRLHDREAYELLSEERVVGGVVASCSRCARRLSIRKGYKKKI